MSSSDLLFNTALVPEKKAAPRTKIGLVVSNIWKHKARTVNKHPWTSKKKSECLSTFEVSSEMNGKLKDEQTVRKRWHHMLEFWYELD